LAPASRRHCQLIAVYWSNLHFQQGGGYISFNTLIRGNPKLRTTKFDLNKLETSPYSMVQNAFQCHEPFRRGTQVTDRQTDGRTRSC